MVKKSSLFYFLLFLTHFLFSYSLFDLSNSTDLNYYLQLKYYETSVTLNQFHILGYEKKYLFYFLNLINNDQIKIVLLMFLMSLLQFRVAYLASLKFKNIFLFSALFVFILILFNPVLINTNMHLVRQNIAFYFMFIYFFSKENRNSFIYLLLAFLFHEVTLVFFFFLLLKKHNKIIVFIPTFLCLIAYFYLQITYSESAKRFLFVFIHFFSVLAVLYLGDFIVYLNRILKKNQII